MPGRFPLRRIIELGTESITVSIYLQL
jgi:hypothetical protein